MARLRAADGCPWDRQQTFASIAPYTIEEAYEVADAIERGDMRHLKDELGDLLFQVVFHSQMASEAGQFDFEAVAGAICDKLLRRHPHVFGDGAPLSAAEQSIAWEEIKARGARLRADASALHGVPNALPALLRAYKLSKRAARVGFDFEHAARAPTRWPKNWPRCATPRRTIANRRRTACPQLARYSKKSAICCSRPRIWRANSMSTRKRRCAPPMQNSSGASAAWNPGDRARRSILRSWISTAQESLWQAVKRDE